jgi:hypothetical protein
MLLILVIPATAFAVNPLQYACSAGGGGGGSTACTSQKSGDPIAGPNGVLKKATLIIATISGIAAVIIIIISGLRMITANGDAQAVSSARRAILNALAGLVIILVAASIITFVISKI